MDRAARRQFLLSFAEKMGFDPMIAANWKGKRSLLLANQVYMSPNSTNTSHRFIKGVSLMAAYGNSLKAVLRDNLPETFAESAIGKSHR